MYLFIIIISIQAQTFNTLKPQHQRKAVFLSQDGGRVLHPLAWSKSHQAGKDIGSPVKILTCPSYSNMQLFI